MMNISWPVLATLILGVILVAAMTGLIGMFAIDEVDIKVKHVNAKLAEADAKLKQAEDMERKAAATMKEADAKLAEKTPENVAAKLAEADAKLAEAKDRERRADAQFQAANDAFRKANAKVSVPEPTCDELFDQIIMYGLAVVAGTSIGTEEALLLRAVEYVEQGKESADKFKDKCSVTDDQTVIVNALTDVMQAAGGTDTSVADTPRVHSSCALFCDSTGYEPQWAKTMGEWQASSKCMSIMDFENYGTRDYDWCTELNGYMLDKMMGG